jgi:vanillate/3-O-methylgallate O-demethylase
LNLFLVNHYKLKKGRYNVATTCVVSKFKFQVSGPNLLYVLEKVTGESLRDIGFMRFRSSRINGRKGILLRQGMAGEVGFEVQGPTKYSREIFDAILKAGEEFGIRRLNSRVATINHREACFPTITHDYIRAISGEAEKDIATLVISSCNQ